MIRNATTNDLKVLNGLNDFIVSLELDILKEVSKDKFFEILEYCFNSSDDRFSYKNCRVYEEDGNILGFAFSYHYSELEKMKNFWYNDAVKKFNLSNQSIIFDYDEMLDDEYYLDTLYVFAESRGKGVGNKFLTDFVNADYKIKSLNVAKSNDGAKKLYASYGFKDKCEIYIGHEYYDHMVLEK